MKREINSATTTAKQNIQKILQDMYDYIYEATLYYFDEGEFAYDYDEHISEFCYDLQQELESIAYDNAESDYEEM